jgi:hypothetical protein
MQSSLVNIQTRLLHNYVCLIVGGVEVVGRSGGVLNRGDPKGGGACPPGGDPHDGGIGQKPAHLWGRMSSRLTWIQL